MKAAEECPGTGRPAKKLLNHVQLITTSPVLQDAAPISLPCRLATGVLGEVGLKDLRSKNLRTVPESACHIHYGKEARTVGGYLRHGRILT